MLTNQDVADVLFEIADILEMQDVEFKPRAYRKAAQNILSMSEDINVLVKEDRVEDIPGVGKHISEKVKELVTTGKLKYFEKLKKQMPVDVESLMQVEGMGPKTIKKLYKKLGTRNLADLEKAAKAGKIEKLKGLGKTVEKNILESIGFAKAPKRFVLGFVYHDIQDMVDKLKALSFVNQVSVAGSVRRMKETIGDVDILVTSSKPSKVMDFFTKMSLVKKVIAKGTTKSSVKLSNNMNVDLRVVDDKSFGAALQYFTGNKAHNVVLRKIAIKKGLKLNEYGLFKKDKLVAGKTEQEVYKALGLPYIEPELREDIGEIDAALKKKLPKILSYQDVKGDLHCHTKQSDGSNTAKEMALAAQKLKRKYIVISDHTGVLKIAHGLSDKDLLKQKAMVNKINISGIKVLSGCEVNIKKDGSLDIKDSTLKQLDIVTASVHHGFKGDSTQRILKAMDNPNIDIIGHPTGRIINGRKGYSINLSKVFQKAHDTNTAMEINSFPDRLDLSDVNCKTAKDYKVKLAISTDAHNTEHLRFLKFGIATARRGWLEKKDVINCLSVDKLLKFFSS